METIKTGKEKQEQFTNEYSRLNRALKYGFYLESVAIDYAIIEDRLVSFLHYAGIVSRHNEELKINKDVYPYMRALLGKRPADAILVKNISVKMSIVRALLEMTEEEAARIDAEAKSRLIPGYMLDLYKYVADRVNKSSILATFQDLEVWRDERNQLIHALLSKTANSVEETSKKCAYDGYDISREIDNNLVKPFKKNNNIRKKYRIQ